MGVVVTATAGLSLWIVLWALGIKPFDGFMATILILICAVTMRLLVPILPGQRDE